MSRRILGPELHIDHHAPPRHRRVRAGRRRRQEGRRRIRRYGCARPCVSTFGRIQLRTHSTLRPISLGAEHRQPAAASRHGRPPPRALCFAIAPPLTRLYLTRRRLHGLLEPAVDGVRHGLRRHPLGLHRECVRLRPRGHARRRERPARHGQVAVRGHAERPRWCGHVLRVEGLERAWGYAERLHLPGFLAGWRIGLR